MKACVFRCWGITWLCFLLVFSISTYTSKFSSFVFPFNSIYVICILKTRLNCYCCCCFCFPSCPMMLLNFKTAQFSWDFCLRFCIKRIKKIPPFLPPFCCLTVKNGKISILKKINLAFLYLAATMMMLDKKRNKKLNAAST